MKYLANSDFPGNVRQLENVCHWRTVRRRAECGSGPICREYVPKPVKLR